MSGNSDQPCPKRKPGDPAEPDRTGDSPAASGPNSPAAENDEAKETDDSTKDNRKGGYGAG